MYRYPKCQSFHSIPTDQGICKTFNGFDLTAILKSSSWLETYTETFGGGGHQRAYRSEGVDIDSGFVFSLDTLQSYLITKKARLEEQDSVNTFRIKVHKPGDLPRMEDDKSSWYTIKSNQNDMVTKFISIKGEKVDNKVKIIFSLNQWDLEQ